MSLGFIGQAFPRVLKRDYWEIGMNVHDVTFESHPVRAGDVSPESGTRWAAEVCL